MKKIISLITALIVSAVIFAQNPNNQFNGLYLTDPGAVDTTLIKNTRTNIANNNGNTGGLMFDKTNNKYRVWNPASGIWSDWNLFNTSGITGFWPLGGSGNLTDNVNIIGPGFAFNSVFIDFALTNGNAAGIATSGNDMTVVTNNGNLNIEASNDLRLIGTNSIISANKHSFTAVSNIVAPINLGINTGIPSSIAAGDVGHVTNIFYGNTNAQTFYFNKTLPANIAVNRITFFSAATGTTTTENTFEYDATNNLLYAGGAIAQSPNSAEPSFTINSGTNKSLQITADGIGDVVLVSSGTGVVRIISPPLIQAALATGNTNTEILTLDPVTDRVEIRDASTLVPTLTATQLGFGSGANLLTSEADLTWESTANVLTLGLTSGIHAQLQDEALEFNNAGTFIGGLDYSGSDFRVSGTSRLTLESPSGPVYIRYDGAGTNADFVIVDITGSMRSNCTGAPSGAVYNNGDGILRICP